MTHPPQWATALAKADAVRQANAELKRRLAAMPEAEARQALVGVLAQPTCEQGAAEVYRLLMAVPRWGKAAAHATLKKAGITAVSRRVRDLTPRQRDVICDVLRDPRLVAPFSTRPPLPGAQHGAAA